MMRNRILRNMSIPAVVALLAIFLPFALIKAGAINAYTAQILTLGGVNALMALSVNIICGITGQLSLGQAGFEALGAYSVIILTQNCGIPLPVSMILAALIAAFFGFLIGFPVLKLEGDYLAIVTLAFGEIIRVVLVNLKGVTGGPNGKQFSTVLTASLDWGPALSYLMIVGTLVIVIVLLHNVIHSTSDFLRVENEFRTVQHAQVGQLLNALVNGCARNIAGACNLQKGDARVGGYHRQDFLVKGI